MNLMVIDRVHNSLEYVSRSFIVVGTLALKSWPISMSMTNSLSRHFGKASLMKTQFNLECNMVIHKECEFLLT